MDGMFYSFCERLTVTHVINKKFVNEDQKQTQKLQHLHTALTTITTLVRVQNKWHNNFLWNAAAVTLTHSRSVGFKVYGMKVLHYTCWVHAHYNAGRAPYAALGALCVTDLLSGQRTMAGRAYFTYRGTQHFYNKLKMDQDNAWDIP